LCVIYYTELAICEYGEFAFDAASFTIFLADHQGSSQSDIIAQTQVLAPLNSRPVNAYRKGGATPKTESSLV